MPIFLLFDQAYMFTLDTVRFLGALSLQKKTHRYLLLNTEVQP